MKVVHVLDDIKKITKDMLVLMVIKNGVTLITGKATCAIDDTSSSVPLLLVPRCSLMRVKKLLNQQPQNRMISRYVTRKYLGFAGGTAVNIYKIGK